MRTLALAAAIWTLAGGGALAQDARWTDPAGAFSIDLASQGWGVLDPASDATLYDGEIFIAAPAGDAHGESRCSLEVNRRTGPEISRERLNEGTRRLAEGPTVAAMDDGEFDLERIETPEVDGVVTLDIYGRFSVLDTVQRRFLLYDGDEVLLYTLSCAVAGDNAAALTASRAIAGSLRFH
ncbi:MAG: hypothetical protein K2X34_13675 [Hyphomonadaceae bacterium]|nr:hypothetical protein [Hyphomonadaceae bacterium]